MKLLGFKGGGLSLWISSVVPFDLSVGQQLSQCPRWNQAQSCGECFLFRSVAAKYVAQSNSRNVNFSSSFTRSDYFPVARARVSPDPGFVHLYLVCEFTTVTAAPKPQDVLKCFGVGQSGRATPQRIRETISLSRVRPHAGNPASQLPTHRSGQAKFLLNIERLPHM